MNTIRIIFGYIGIFLIISITFTYLGIYLEKLYLYIKHKPYIVHDEMWLLIGILIAYILIPFYYIPIH